MAKGYSLTAFAGSIQMSRETIYQWQRAHPAFADAIKRAQPARLYFLEKKLLESNGRDTVASIFALKNAAPEEWQDRRYVDQSVSIKADLMTTDQLRAIAAGHDPLLVEGTCEHIPDASQEAEELPNPLNALDKS